MRRFVILALLATGCSGPFRATIRISQDELQQRISANFPVEHGNNLVAVVLDAPRVTLHEGANRVEFELIVGVRALGILGPPATAAISAELYYDNDRNSFYLRDPQVMDLRGIPIADQIQANIREGLNAVLPAALSRVPVYTYGRKDRKERMFLKSVEVRDGQVCAEVGL